MVSTGKRNNLPGQTRNLETDESVVAKKYFAAHASGTDSFRKTECSPNAAQWLSAANHPRAEHDLGRHS